MLQFCSLSKASGLQASSSYICNGGFAQSSVSNSSSSTDQLINSQIRAAATTATATTTPKPVLQKPLVLSRNVPSTSSNRVAPFGRSSPRANHKVTAVVTVARKRNPSPQEILLDKIDSVSDMAGQNIVLQLVSCETDQRTGSVKRSTKAVLKDWSKKASISADKVQYTAEFTISSSFGTPGAITIVNNHQNEFFIETIALQGPPSLGTIYFPCHSWVQPFYKYPHENVFFSNQVYLPKETPAGLKELRDQDKASFRGNGKGCRKAWDRIYDYDVYNDVGNPDKSKEFTRPVLGGKLPYPRRCKTGRSRTKADPNAEIPLEMGTTYYVPRDEAFEGVKKETFLGNSLKGVIHQLVPTLANSFKEGQEEFQSFEDIDKLYQEGVKLRKSVNEIPLPSNLIKNLENSIHSVSNMLQYPKPDILSKDRFAWLRDDEFGRQALAGANPVHIQQVQEFPLKSKLDREVYGCQESAIKAEHIQHRLEGLTVEEAIKEKRLFVLDYHDAYMPFVAKVNEMDGRKMYASRTILFHTKAGVMTPVAIELCLPPAAKGGQAKKRVFTPGQDAATYWKWQLAKAHVTSNDAGFHQLVNHWLRSHAAVEPYIIATHRQLSRMHPVFKLLQPHFRYTLEINASARQLLISADGVIENCFTPGPFSLEISSSAYASMWRFDHESLPADLIKRGMAIEDQSEPNGVKLVVEDYPYAADGLLLWDAIKTWVNEYISLYYKDAKSVENDMEIQAWWNEIRTQGHQDKQHEPWWPSLKTPDDLKRILTTIIWIVSGFHAAVNFGQYAYGGYVPNRPCLTRRLIPEDGTLEYHEFASNPEKFFLSTIPNQLQATTTMAIVDTLSSHSPDEEYLGKRAQTKWTSDARAIEAFNRFSTIMESIERKIGQRNMDPKLKHRNGVGVLPYELLVPTSRPGRTTRGVPNSISI